jgi:hypothetical protein
VSLTETIDGAIKRFGGSERLAQEIEVEWNWKKRTSTRKWVRKNKGGHKYYFSDIINLETGIFYSNGSEAARAAGIPFGTLHNYLKGNRKNKTQFIRLPHERKSHCT